MVDRTHERLHPAFSEKLTQLEHILFEQRYFAAEGETSAIREFQTTDTFRVFETYRTPKRQSEVLAAGKSKAGPGQSAHQYGLAADVALWRIEGDMEQWSWAENADWDWLKGAANACGLIIPIKWDRGHVVDPLWFKLKRAARATLAEVEPQRRD